jgi:hypothetical protein
MFKYQVSPSEISGIPFWRFQVMLENLKEINDREKAERDQQEKVQNSKFGAMKRQTSFNSSSFKKPKF